MTKPSYQRADCSHDARLRKGAISSFFKAKATGMGTAAAPPAATPAPDSASPAADATAATASPTVSAKVAAASGGGAGCSVQPPPSQQKAPRRGTISAFFKPGPQHPPAPATAAAPATVAALHSGTSSAGTQIPARYLQNAPPPLLPPSHAPWQVGING